jgi:Rad3-related DNA helicase
MSVLPPPNLLGAPSKYSQWRSQQAEAVLAAAESKKRFVVINAPTGFGKSLVYVATSLLTDARSVELTATKALQTQLVDDFHESGMIEIRGLNSYPCIEGTPTGRFGDMRREGYRADRGLPMMCDEAPCQSGAWCPKRGGGCEYYDAYNRATYHNSKLVVTNYAYWMSIHKYGEGLGKVDLLVMDEAHSIFDEIGNFVGTDMHPGELEALMSGASDARCPGPGTSQADWIEWGQTWYGEVSLQLERIKIAIREHDRNPDRGRERLSYATLRRARDLKRVQVKLETIATMRGDWIIDFSEDSRKRTLIKFAPIWPGEYAEQYLFLGIPKIIMVSATINRKTPAMFGIGMADMDWKEYGSTFPKANRPTIFIGAGAMNRNSEAESLPKVVAMADNIIARRTDRKAIIQTVSYKRAVELYRRSKYRDMMIVHDSTDAKEKIARFKDSKQPVILVSPVLDTGYDFKYEQAEYQIIIKVPFPVSTDKVVQARAKRDTDYKDYVTGVDLAQMVGRIVRADDDTGETFIIDSDFGWWYSKRGYRFVPRSFAEAVIQQQMLGQPLPKQRGR